jgi:hypothetical protein
MSSSSYIPPYTTPTSPYNEIDQVGIINHHRTIEISRLGYSGTNLSVSFENGGFDVGDTIFIQGINEQGSGTSLNNTNPGFTIKSITGSNTYVLDATYSDYKTYISGGYAYTSGQNIVWDNSTESYWNTFFGTFYPVSSDNYNENPDYYLGLFGEYYRDWKRSSTADFSTYLNKSSEVSLRYQSPYLWLYTLLTELFDAVQNSTIYEADRTNFLTDAQQKAVSALSGITYQVVTKSKAATKAYYNQVYQQWLQIYLGYKSFMSDKTESISNQITSTNDNLSSQSSLMSGIMDQMQEMISGIIKGA